MKHRSLGEMSRANERIDRGAAAPARVWEVSSGEKGRLRRREIDPRAFQRRQKRSWDETIAATRKKLRLSQSRFARLLGISVRTLHHWEQGRRTPSGAARVLLRVAAQHPRIVLKAAA